MTVNNAIETVTSALSSIVALAVSLIGVFLLVDILFPSTTNIVGSVAELVNSFISQGLVGLITLIVFVAILSRD